MITNAEITNRKSKGIHKSEILKGGGILIKSIKLKNWKSYKESVLYIDPLTIVIGTNASGKSNAIDALILLSRIASGVGIFQAISGDVTLDSLRGGIDWVCKKILVHLP